MKLKEGKQHEELQEKSKLSLTRRSTSPEKSKPPPEKPSESQIEFKLQGFKKNHEKKQRTISYLQHTPFTGIFVLAGKSHRRSPAGLKREEKLRKNVMELKKEGQPENPLPFYLKLRVRRKTWPPPPCNPPEKEKKLKITYTHTDQPRASLFYGEERDINRNEQAFWCMGGRMVRCEEEENGENGERGGARAVRKNGGGSSNI